MKKILSVLLFITVVSCKGPVERDALYNYENVISDNQTTISQLFSEKVRITPLETDTNCLLSRIGKLKRYENAYYIKTMDNKLFTYDDAGKFVNVLNKQGNGPEEYVRIEDFDILNNSGKKELWVADNKKIQIYDAETLENIRTISLSSMIHKFKILSDTHLLLLTGNNEDVLSLSDYEGNINKTYLSKEIPYLLFRGVQFIKHNTGYLFQLGVSNNYVKIDTATNEFSEGRFLSSSSLLNREDLLKMFDKSGYDFLQDLGSQGYVNNVRFFGDIMWAYIRDNGGQYICRIDSDSFLSRKLEKETFLSTFTFCESDRGLLFFADPSDLKNQEYLIENNIDFSETANPYIIEYLL